MAKSKRIITFALAKYAHTIKLLMKKEHSCIPCPIRLSVRTRFSFSKEQFDSAMGYQFINRTEKKFLTMANHKSSLKRIRQSEKRRLENRYWAKTARNAVRRVRRMTDKEEATAAYNKVSSLLQRLGRKNIISKNKAANLCSSLSKHINKI